MIGLIDYGLSNLRSVQKAFERLGQQTRLIGRADEIAGVDRLVLPGVGAFGAGMDGLATRDLVPAILDAVDRGVPLLGICLGMQLLFEESTEGGRHRGLGLLSGRVVRFSAADLLIPHMGWNRLEVVQSHPLLIDLPAQAYAYFVHSYLCVPTDPAATLLATTDYGGPFASVVGEGHVFGLQFHPEKSQSVGLTLLRNFAAYPRERQR